LSIDVRITLNDIFFKARLNW